MSREEEIKKASDELFKTRSCSKTYRMGFEVGAMWADNNPKTPWINTKDALPCNYKDLISKSHEDETLPVISFLHGDVCLSKMQKVNEKWCWKDDEPEY